MLYSRRWTVWVGATEDPGAVFNSPLPDACYKPEHFLNSSENDLTAPAITDWQQKREYLPFLAKPNAYKAGAFIVCFKYFHFTAA